MNIGVNTRLLLNNKLEGIGQFANETLQRITIAHPEHQFYFFFDRPHSDEFIYSNNVQAVHVWPQARHPFLWYLFFEIGIPRALKRHKIDLFFSPDGWLSLNTDVDSVNVIHDINFEHHPDQIKWLPRNYYHYYFPRYAQKAKRIATVSEFSKADIVKQYGIPEDRIDVVYNGVKELFKPISKEEKDLVRSKYSEGKPYFVFVGLITGRKNLTGLFNAFDRFRQNNAGYKLVIVGEKKWWSGPIEEAYLGMEFKEDVIFTGRLSDDDLVKVMAAALALCYVPIFEGFGIPILEGMKSGIPVITSNITSMPEVGGEAVVLADPYDHESIADAMQKVSSDNEFRDQLIEKGFDRASQFSWDKTADRVWNCIQHAIR